MKTPKFQIGDQCKIVKYGAVLWSSKEIDGLPFLGTGTAGYFYDSAPEKIGMDVIITEISMSQGIPKYATNKFAWADQGQLELIHRPEYK